MSRTVKDATTKAFHYETTQALCAHVLAFVAAYNFAKHLKALRWRTPFQAICDTWKTDAAAFKIDPHHLTPGLYTGGLLLCLGQRRDRRLGLRRHNGIRGDRAVALSGQHGTRRVTRPRALPWLDQETNGGTGCGTSARR